MVEKRVTEEKTEKKEVKEETITLVKPERGDETRLVVVKDTLPVGAGKMVVQDAKQECLIILPGSHVGRSFCEDCFIASFFGQGIPVVSGFIGRGTNCDYFSAGRTVSGFL